MSKAHLLQLFMHVPQMWSAPQRLSAQVGLTLLLCLGSWQHLCAQIQILDPPGDQTYDCENAIPFCDDLVFSFSPGNSSPLWFSFEVPYAQYVEISVTGIVKLKLHHIIDHEDPCHDLYCNTTLTDSMSCDVLDTSYTCGFRHYLQAGLYYICSSTAPNADHHFLDLIEGDLGCSQTDCEDCLPGFLPVPGMQYVVSAWVKEVDAPLGTLNYTTPAVQVSTPNGPLNSTFQASLDRPVIEGWQLIEGAFEMPLGTWPFALTLHCTSGECLFDDVRIFPADGSMKCYVYDAVNLRYVAELDERHFATFYEYDNEGRLVRVKKETERGIMTIQESRQNAAHVAP